MGEAVEFLWSLAGRVEAASNVAAAAMRVRSAALESCLRMLEKLKPPPPPPSPDSEDEERMRAGGTYERRHLASVKLRYASRENWKAPRNSMSFAGSSACNPAIAAVGDDPARRPSSALASQRTVQATLDGRRASSLYGATFTIPTSKQTKNWPT